MKHAAQCIPVEYQLMLLAIMHSVCVEILSDLKILMMRVPLQIAFFLNLGSILASVITGWKLVEVNTVAFSNYADKLEEVNPIPRWLHEKNIISIPTFAMLMQQVSTALLVISGIVLPTLFLYQGGVPLFLILSIIFCALIRLLNLANDREQIESLIKEARDCDSNETR
jgi:hypothetical protein